MGILAIAMMFGLCAALALLIAGQSFLMALAIYSGVGVLAAFVIVGAVLAGSVRRPQNKQGARQISATT